MNGAKKTRILIVTLYQYGSFGSGILTDVLRAGGFTVYNIFFKRDKTNGMTLPSALEKSLFLGLVQEIKPDLIGFSTRSTFFTVAKELTGLVKNHSKAPVVWGGAHPIICPDESIRCADIVCTGEGEKPLLELANRIENGTDYRDITGLWVRENGNVIKNAQCALVDDLDALPLPDFENGINTFSIEDGQLLKGDPVFNDTLTHYNFMTGRGCPFSCNFCSNSVLRERFRNFGRFVRQRGVDNVIMELATVKSKFKNLRTISTNDEIFGYDAAWLGQFCKRYKSEIDLAFHCDIHPSYVTDEKIATLSRLGLKTISMGLQSCSENIRKNIFGRNTPDKMLLDAGKIFKKYGIFPSYDLILDNPLETEDDLNNTIKFIMTMPRPYRLNMYSLQYHPNTQLTNSFLEKGLITAADIDGNSLKGFTQWHVNLRSSNPDVNKLFFHRLLAMLAAFIRFSGKDPSKVIAPVPLWMVKFIYKHPIFRKHQFLTAWAAYLPPVTYGIGLLLQGDLAGILRRIRK